MLPKELVQLLPQIITSWQVIVVTLVLVLFMYLVSYVARSYHRPHTVSKTKPKKAKAAPAPKSKTDNEEDGEENSADDADSKS